MIKYTALFEDKEVEKYLDKIKITEYKIYNLLLNKEYDQVISSFINIKLFNFRGKTRFNII